MKSRLSTKMIGETLETHCETQFNLNRAQHLKTHILKRIMMLHQEVKATIFLENLIITKLK